MEVLIRKTKITKSIVKQSLQANLEIFKNLNNYDVLGWCLVDNRKIVLIYDRLTQQILTYRYTPFSTGKYQYLKREGVQREDKINGGWIFPEVLFLYIEFTELNSHFKIEQKEGVTDEDMKLMLQKAQEFARTIARAGQIYL